MKRETMLAAALLLTLTGCDQLGLGGGTAGAENNAAANQAAGGKDPAAQNAQVSDAGVTTSRSLQPVAATTGDKPAAAAGGIEPSMLVGRWGDNGDCTKDIEIFADGTFRSYTGGEGNWSLDGDRLTIGGGNGSTTLRIQSLNANTLLVMNPDGTMGSSQRC